MMWRRSDCAPPVQTQLKPVSSPRGSVPRRNPLRHRSAGLLAVACAAALALAACSSSGSGTNGSGPSSGAGGNPVSSLVPSVKSLFKNITEPVTASAYANYSAPKPPWKVCFEDAYEGNVWRITVRKQLAHLASLFQKSGKVSSFSYSVSNDTPTLENSQLRSFIDKGCNLILLTAGSSTGDNATITQARQRGAVVVAFNNYVTSPDAQVVDQPWYQWGAQQAQNIATRLHGHGTVIMLKGISGESVAVGENSGANAVWKKYPGITVIPAQGNWTPGPTTNAVSQVLATHSGPINAVWTTGSELWYVVKAFQKAGRPVPIVTGSPEGNTLALAHGDHSLAAKLFGYATLPVPIADYAFDTGIRILSGQHPKVSPILFPLSKWSGTSLTGWYASCMTQAAGESPFPVPPTAPLTTSQMNSYFTNGKPVPPYSYQGTLPPVC